MRSQLKHIVEISSLPNVTVQVLPFTAGAHLAMDDNFVIMDFAEPVPSMVYSEGLSGWIYMEQPSDIERYGNVFDTLGVAALDEDDSIMFTAKIIRSR